ncbi:MAG: hypothetical protein KJN72_12325 [Woeseia sp.]|nr:hypothetical protein [Woeseia sp.]
MKDDHCPEHGLLEVQFRQILARAPGLASDLESVGLARSLFYSGAIAVFKLMITLDIPSEAVLAELFAVYGDEFGSDTVPENTDHV